MDIKTEAFIQRLTRLTKSGLLSWDIDLETPLSNNVRSTTIGERVIRVSWVNREQNDDYITFEIYEGAILIEEEIGYRGEVYSLLQELWHAADRRARNVDAVLIELNKVLDETEFYDPFSEE